MKNFYTIDDIASLLSTKVHVVWDGTITDIKKIDGRLKVSSRSAKVSDFEQACTKKSENEYGTITLNVFPVNNLDRQISICIYVDKCYFKIADYFDVHSAPFYVSYDDEWQELLFQNHPEHFANEYVLILEKRLKSIASRAQVKGIFKKRKYLSEEDEKKYLNIKEKLDSVNKYLNRNVDYEL